MPEGYETTMLPDDYEKDSIPYASLRPTIPAPVAQAPQPQQPVNQTPPATPPQTEQK